LCIDCSIAIITGATDGIGKAFAFELAKKGLNILIIARSQDKLESTKKELTDKYPKIEVQTVIVDFSNFNEAARERVAAAIKALDIGVLINNVGMSYPFTKYFHELSNEDVERLMSLNVDSTTWMTKIVVPGMVERKRGAIVNIGSAAGVTVSPLLAEYGAAKSYITMFSRALNAEYNKFNVHVQCQVALFVTTKLAKIKKASLFVPSPEDYVRSAVRAIGYEPVTSPYWTHALQLWIMAILPEDIVTWFTKNMHMDIRKKGMKKEAENKKKDT
jgi:17beta-estradiol 17-dehydrogenase / very-long-chain 3-oxoacyl-CoA reductase